MPFTGYCRLEFIAFTEERFKPGDRVELPDETPEQQRDIEGLLNMGVIQRTDPAGNPPDEGDPELLGRLIAENNAAQRSQNNASPKPRQPSGRAAAKLKEKQARESS